MEWFAETDKESLGFCREYINFYGKSDKEFLWALIKTMLASVADMAIMQMQDCLELGAASRMNTPSTVCKNWQWRMKKGAATKTLAKKLAMLAKLYGRAEKELV